MSAIKNHKMSMMLYMLGNSALCPPPGVADDSFQSLLDGLVTTVVQMEADGRVFEKTYFPQGAPEFDEQLLYGCYTVLFLYDQCVARGYVEAEQKQLAKLVTKMPELKASVDALHEYVTNPSNIFFVLKNDELVKAITNMREIVV